MESKVCMVLGWFVKHCFLGSLIVCIKNNCSGCWINRRMNIIAVPLTLISFGASQLLQKSRHCFHSHLLFEEVFIIFAQRSVIAKVPQLGSSA